MHQSWNKPLRTAVGALFALGMIVPGALTASAHHASKPAAKPTGTIVYADNQFPDTLNPFEAATTVDVETTDLTMPGGYALYYNTKGTLAPGMLTKVPSQKNGGISKDGKTITVFIRKGLRWSNGKPITSKDIVFAWKLGLDPLLGTCIDTCDKIKSIKTPNSLEAVMKMKQVYAPAIPMAFPGFMPSSWGKLGHGVHNAAKTLSDVNFTYEDSSYVTAGPYKVSQFVTNNRIVLVPNKYYNGPGGAPKVAKMIFQFYPDVNTEIAGAIKHESDVTTDYTQVQIPTLKANKKKFKTIVATALSPEHLELNSIDATVNGKPNPLVNLKVRQAINLAIDRFGIQKSVFGIKSKKEAANLFTYDAPWIQSPSIKQPYANPAITGAWDPIAKKYIPYGPQSVKDAKKLLQGTPCASGCTVEISSTTLPQRAQEAAVVTKNLSTIGITASFTAIPSTQFFATFDKGGTLTNGNFMMGLFAYTGVTPEPDLWKTSVVGKFVNRKDPNHSTLDQNYSGLNDPIVNNDFKKGAATFNKAERRKYYYQAQEEIAKKAVWIDLAIRPSVCTYDSKVPMGTNNGFAGSNCNWDAYNWKVAR